MLGDKSVKKIRGFLDNLNNPHILGLDAREVFFLEDGIILAEGQEDVIFYKKLFQQLNVVPNGHFFGWGVGGAHNMETIAEILYDLGFEKVAGILDSDKQNVREKLSGQFKNYSFYNIPTNDVRTKPARPERAQVEGLIDRNGDLREEFRNEIDELFRKLNVYLEKKGSYETPRP